MECIYKRYVDIDVLENHNVWESGKRRNGPVVGIALFITFWLMWNKRNLAWTVYIKAACSLICVFLKFLEYDESLF